MPQQKDEPKITGGTDVVGPTTQDNFRKVTNNADLEFDESERYGGAYLTSVLSNYDGVRIVDIYNLDYQKRFEFFHKNPRVAFLMFSDMIEKTALDDESLLFCRKGGISFFYTESFLSLAHN